MLDREIEYDGDNRPVSVTTPSGGTVTYLYGPDGARLKKVTSTGTYKDPSPTTSSAGSPPPA